MDVRNSKGQCFITVWVWLVRFNKNKIMIDKKQLIEELLECVKDATDTETQITGLSMCATLMNEVLDEALTIPVVSNMLCGSFDADNSTSSATKCKCGREKWEHPKPRN